MLNSYTLEVYRKQDKPCFVVTIKHVMCAGVFFFNSLKDANEFIANEKASLDLFGELRYNENGCTGDYYNDCIGVIKTVLSCDNIHIGENGRTYYKE